MQRTAVINVVGLTRRCLGASTPCLSAFAKRHRVAGIKPAFPAVTCTVQSAYLTGETASHHGIVANGWYDRDLAEVHFWKQSNRLVQAPKVWELLRARQPKFTCAKLFWWYNMYSTADYSVTPRPSYPADGRKVFDIYTHPASVRDEIQRQLGPFPFPCFWGPAAGVDSPQGNAAAVSQWIGDSARWIEERYQPTLNLIYLPHLDYNFQRWGPNDARVQTDLKAIDEIAGGLIDFFTGRGITPLVVSEYGIGPVDQPIHLNRRFREQGWITVREELGLEKLDYGASQAFAVADHQIAHVYVREPSLIPAVRAFLQAEPGVAEVLGAEEKKAAGVDHPRAGDLVAVARSNAWFSYYYWLEDRLAPEFARTVDIHRKPGYDPVELFIDPQLSFPKLRIARRLLQKNLGFRMLMDVIPLDATLVRGSHGVCPADPMDFPVCIGANAIIREKLVATDVRDVIVASVMG
jgi:predicted AlkP superfamily pyrophosphatase or phosphodiesterase